jgi:hypothetical protein
VYATAATFKLPAELGGVEGAVGKVSITEAGLDFDAAQMAIPLPDIPMGDAMAFTNNTAKLSTVRSSEADKFILDVSSTLNLNVAGSLTQQPVQFTMSTGSDGSFEMNGNVGGLVVDLGGVMLSLKEVAITTTGLSVSEASVVLPAELGGATATVSDVSIGMDGLAIGGGIFTLPELQLADGNVVISGVMAELVPVNGEWTLAAQGTVQIALGGSPASLVTFTLGSDGQLKGTAKNLSLDLGVAQLALGDATLSFEGLTAANASFTVPALFGLSGKVDTASITAEGLSFGTAELSVALPDLSLGDYGFAHNSAKLTASTTAEGPMYMVSIETTMVSNVAGTVQERPLRLVLTPSASPEAVAKMGSVNGLMVNLNGVTVLFEGLTPQ